MDRISRDMKTRMVLHFAALVALAVGCARTEAASAAGAAGAAAPVPAAVAPSPMALQIADRDCAVIRSVDRRRGASNASLDDAQLVSIARVPVRSSSIRYTWSGWKLELSSSQGPGAIVQVEMPGGRSCFIGQGFLFGWPQESLASAYRQFVPRAGPVTAEIEQQLD